jgi:hypothetical protein
MVSIKPAAAIAAAAIVFGVVASAHAQTLDVNVPFAFTVQDVTLPAGHYELNTDLSSGTVELRGERGTRGAAMVSTIPSEGHDPAGNTPSLTFSRYEGGYRLTGIWESARDGRAVVKR